MSTLNSAVPVNHSTATSTAHGGHTMQRVSTEPIVHQPPQDWLLHWPNQRPKAQPAQIQSWHQAPQPLLKHSHARKPSTGRVKTQTMYTSHPRQHPLTYPNASISGPPLHSSHVSHHDPMAYGGSPYQFPATLSDTDAGYNSQGSPLSGVLNLDPHNSVLTSGAMGAADHNHHFVPNHINNGQFGSLHDQHFPLLPLSSLNKVPLHHVLRSQPPCAINAGNAQSTNSQLCAITKKQPQHRQMEEETNEEETDDLGLHYDSIEAAREAERPKFRVKPKSDVTIPKSVQDKKAMVARMVLCMMHTDSAEDNEGMIKQWKKLKQDEARVEQAAWRILVRFLL